MTKKISEKAIFKTKAFMIKDVEVEHEGGERAIHQVIDKRDVSIIVPITANGSLLLIKEYATAFDKYILDLPGGKIDPGISPTETANKELQEEIGYKAGKLDQIGLFTMSPGYLTQKSYIFLARDLTESKLEGDETEPLEIVEYPFEKFEDLIESGELNEARAIAGLYLARKFLKQTRS